MITLMNENVLSAGDKNETWTAYKGWKDKPSRQLIKNKHGRCKEESGV